MENPHLDPELKETEESDKWILQNEGPDYGDHGGLFWDAFFREKRRTGELKLPRKTSVPCAFYKNSRDADLSCGNPGPKFDNVVTHLVDSSSREVDMLLN